MVIELTEEQTEAIVELIKLGEGYDRIYNIVLPYKSKSLEKVKAKFDDAIQNNKKVTITIEE